MYCSHKGNDYVHSPVSEPPHIVRTEQKRDLQGVEQANQRLAWRSESGARPVFVWSRSWL